MHNVVSQRCKHSDHNYSYMQDEADARASQLLLLQLSNVSKWAGQEGESVHGNLIGCKLPYTLTGTVAADIINAGLLRLHKPVVAFELVHKRCYYVLSCGRWCVIWTLFIWVIQWYHAIKYLATWLKKHKIHIIYQPNICIFGISSLCELDVLGILVKS